MDDLKRLEVKYVRDKAKSLYVKDSECFICGTTENLELHHFSSVTELWNKWKRENKINISSVEDILLHREPFIVQHNTELYDEVITLCKECHQGKLHKVYGLRPPLATAQKQKRWCERQRDKRLNNGNT
jgi:5-methylcytosine-specific restriction endonuclease McrA